MKPHVSCGVVRPEVQSADPCSNLFFIYFCFFACYYSNLKALGEGTNQKLIKIKKDSGSKWRVPEVRLFVDWTGHFQKLARSWGARLLPASRIFSFCQCTFFVFLLYIVYTELCYFILLYEIVLDCLHDNFCVISFYSLIF